MRRAASILGAAVLVGTTLVFVGAGVVIGVALGACERREERARRGRR